MYRFEIHRDGKWQTVVCRSRTNTVPFQFVSWLMTCSMTAEFRRDYRWRIVTVP